MTTRIILPLLFGTAIAQLSCLPQASGTCSFRLMAFIADTTPSYSCGLHDHTGQALGLPASVCAAGLAIDSPLPWTVDVIAGNFGGKTNLPPPQMAGPDGLWADFQYAGGEYGTAVSPYQTSDCGNMCQQVCIQFPCPGF
jgi:hypothetical protein